MTRKTKIVLANCDFPLLVREMELAKNKLALLPDDQEWTLEELETLEDLRWAALRLAEEAEATIKTFDGRIGDDHARQP